VVAEPGPCHDDERDDDKGEEGQREDETQPAGPVTERREQDLAHGKRPERPREVLHEQ
jgi:hypothetical protein